MQDPIKFLDGMRSLLFPNISESSVVKNISSFVPATNSMNISSIPTKIINSISDAGAGAVQNINDRFKFEFNSSHLENVIPKTMKMQTEISDVLIYVMCAVLSLSALAGILGVFTYKWWKRRRRTLSA
jgi:hypothetical protein